MRNQQGNLFESHGAWYVRYREHGKKNPVAHRLASQAEYPKKSEVIPLKNEYIDRLNRIGFTSRAGGGIIDFVEKTYFPTIENRLARSTVKGYTDAWRCHIKDRVKGRVRDFRTVDGKNLMCEIEATNKTKTDDLARGRISTSR